MRNESSFHTQSAWINPKERCDEASNGIPHTGESVGWSAAEVDEGRGEGEMKKDETAARLTP